MSTIYYLLSIICIVFFSLNNLHSEVIKPKQYGTEKRFKTWTYHPNGVSYLETHYMHPIYIEFDDKETINTIYSPKSSFWNFIPMQNRLFIKAVQDSADTTLTVMTNQRVYFFELHAKYATGPFDPSLTFFIKFKYPYQTREIGQGAGDSNSIIQYVTPDIPDLSMPEKFNFNYTVSGDYNIIPIKVFDDGQFTYMEFSEKNNVLPAIFLVNSDGQESIVNFRMIGQFVAIETVGAVFTLRYGTDTVCIFNETKPQVNAHNNKK